MPRIRHWLDQSVRHAVNEAAQAFNAIRYWCEQTEADIETNKAAEPVFCRGLEMAVKQIRNLLPDFPAPSSERRAETTGEVTGMAGTRVTRLGDDREWFSGGEDGDQAAVRGDDDRDL